MARGLHNGPHSGAGLCNLGLNPRHKRGAVGVLVMLNNFFHDLSVALFTCALLGLAALWRAAPRAGSAARPFVESLDRLGVGIARWSFGGIVGFGAVRAAAFREFEWLPAVGRAQVPALALKHVLLAALLVGALVAASRARRTGRAALAGSAR